MKSRGLFAGGGVLKLMALPLLLAVSMTASASSQVSVSIVDGEIVLTPDPLPVGDGHDVLLTWRITTPGWTFAEDGIEIADASDEFSDPELSADKRVFTEIDKDDNGLSYKYSVTVTDGGEPISKDPAIQNGGH